MPISLIVFSEPGLYDRTETLLLRFTIDDTNNLYCQAIYHFLAELRQQERNAPRDRYSQEKVLKPSMHGWPRKDTPTAIQFFAA